MLSNNGRSLLKRIAVLALCAFISIAYMPGVAYALEGEEADSNGSQAEETLEGGNADAGDAVNEEAGGEDGSGEEAGSGDETETGEEDIDGEEPADEEEPVVGEDPAGEDDQDDPADGDDPEEDPDDGEEGSMSYTCAEPIVYTEGVSEGYTEEDEDGNEYFYYELYDADIFRPGDVLTVNGVDYTMPDFDEDYEGDTYFEDSEGNKIYAYDLSVNSNQYDNHWIPGNEDAKITVEYGYDTDEGWVSMSCDIDVTIVANPIQNISFEYAEPLNLIENASGEMYDGEEYNEETDEFVNVRYFRYSLPYKGREGNKLIVNDTVYTCNDDDEFVNEDGDIIDAGDIDIDDDQSYENQWTPDNPGHITVTYKGKSFVMEAVIHENPVESISFQFAEPLTYYEEAGGYWSDYETYNDEGEVESSGQYYYYYRPSKNDEGNKLTVHYKDGTEKVFTCNDDDVYTDGQGSVIDAEEIEIDDDQSYENQWSTTHPGKITVTYWGRTTELTVTIQPNPVHEIEFQVKKPVTLTEGMNGWEDGDYYYDEEAQDYVEYKYFVYDCPDLCRTGNKLIVNGTEYTYKYDYKLHERVFMNADGDVIKDNLLSYSTNQSYEHQWTVADGGKITVTYMGRSCEVPVTIQPNPVQSIEFVTAEPLTVYENVNGEVEQTYDSDDNPVSYFRYDVPSLFKPGSKLIINGTKEYTYDADSGKFVNGNDKIDRYKLAVDDDQNYDNQWSKTNPGKITVEYMKQSCDVAVTVVDNPVQNIEFVPAQEEIYVLENTGGEIDREGEDENASEPYFRYYTPNIFTRGSKLIVDGVEYNFSYNGGDPAYVNEDSDGIDVILVEEYDEYPNVTCYTDQSASHPWTVGSTGHITVSYMGREAVVPVEVRPNGIESISYVPAEQPSVYENLDGDWGEDEEGNEYFVYADPFRPRLGDKLYVDEKEYTYKKVPYQYEDGYISYDYYYMSEDGQMIYGDEVDHSDDQSSVNHWTKDNPGKVTIKYGGKSYVLTVNVISNPVESIEFTNGSVPRIMEHTHGNIHEEYYDEEYVFYRYDFPGFKAGDQLTVNYSDGRGSVVYTAQDTTDEDGDACLAFVSADGSDTIDPAELDYSSDQRTNRWETGEHEFTIRYFDREAEFKVTIYESDVESIAYDPVKPITVYEGVGFESEDYDDEPFYYYDVYEDFNPGDKLTVTRKDGSKTVYTYKLNVTTGRYEFMDDAGNKMDDDPEIYSFQHDEHWHLGTGNTMVLSCFGEETEVPVTVKENPVASITTVLSHPVVVKTENSTYRRDLYGKIYRNYFIDSSYNSGEEYLLFVDGDKVVVTFKDNTKKTFTYDAEREWFYDENGEYDDYLSVDDEQYKEHWFKGGENPVYMIYMGVRSTPVRVNIDEVVDPAPISDANAVIEGTFTYTGKAFTPSVSVKYGDRRLFEGRDYELAYVDNVDAGTAAAVLTGINGFTGTKRVEFTIAPKPVTPTVTLSQTEFEYNGEEQRPETVNVTVDGMPAEADITWPATSVEGGTYTVTATLKGNYTGTGSATYTITVSPEVQAAAEAAGKAAEAKAATDTAAQAAEAAKTKAAKATKASSAAVTAARASVSAAKDYLAKANAAKEAADAALEAAKATGRQALIDAAQEVVSQAEADVQAAEAAVKAANTALTKALDNQWKGVYYSKLSKVTILTPSVGKKYMTVKWKKLTSKQKNACSKIEVQYSLKKTFPRTQTVTKTVTKTKTSLKVTKLKSKKTYYVRVRTIKTVNGVKKVSKWSKTKTAKIK